MWIRMWTYQSSSPPANPPEQLPAEPDSLQSVQGQEPPRVTPTHCISRMERNEEWREGGRGSHRPGLCVHAGPHAMMDFCPTLCPT